MVDIKKGSKHNKRNERFFELKVFYITIKQIRPIIWVSLLIAVFGAINYQGKIFTINNANKFIIGSNEVLYQTLITYITGLILLFLVELLPKTKKRIAISTTLGNNIQLIKERVEHLLNEIGKRDKNTNKKFELNEDALVICSETINIDTDKVKVWYYPDYNFRQFAIRSCEEIKIATNEMLTYSDALNEKWVYSLSKVSGTSDKIIKSLDIRFPVPKIEIYWLWGLYAETERLMEHLNRFDKAYFKLAIANAPQFHPHGLTFTVDRGK